VSIEGVVSPCPGADRSLWRDAGGSHLLLTDAGGGLQKTSACLGECW